MNSFLLLICLESVISSSHSASSSTNLEIIKEHYSNENRTQSRLTPVNEMPIKQEDVNASAEIKKRQWRHHKHTRSNRHFVEEKGTRIMGNDKRRHDNWREDIYRDEKGVRASVEDNKLSDDKRKKDPNYPLNDEELKMKALKERINLLNTGTWIEEHSHNTHEPEPAQQLEITSHEAYFYPRLGEKWKEPNYESNILQHEPIDKERNTMKETARFISNVQANNENEGKLILQDNENKTNASTDENNLENVKKIIEAYNILPNTITNYELPPDKEPILYKDDSSVQNNYKSVVDLLEGIQNHKISSNEREMNSLRWLSVELPDHHNNIQGNKETSRKDIDDHTIDQTLNEEDYQDKRWHQEVQNLIEAAERKTASLADVLYQDQELWNDEENYKKNHERNYEYKTKHKRKHTISNEGNHGKNYKENHARMKYANDFTISNIEKKHKIQKKILKEEESHIDDKIIRTSNEYKTHRTKKINLYDDNKPVPRKHKEKPQKLIRKGSDRGNSIEKKNIWHGDLDNNSIDKNELWDDENSTVASKKRKWHVDEDNGVIPPEKSHKRHRRNNNRGNYNPEDYMSPIISLSRQPRDAYNIKPQDDYNIQNDQSPNDYNKQRSDDNNRQPSNVYRTPDNNQDRADQYRPQNEDNRIQNDDDAPQDDYNKVQSGYTGNSKIIPLTKSEPGKKKSGNDDYDYDRPTNDVDVNENDYNLEPRGIFLPSLPDDNTFLQNYQPSPTRKEESKRFNLFHNKFLAKIRRRIGDNIKKLFG